MNGFRLVVVGTLLVCTLTLVSMGVVAVVEPSIEGETNESDTEMGDEIGSFMQVSAAQTSGEVDRGMFGASFDQAADREQVIQDRIDELEAEYDDLEARADSLDNASDDRPEPARQAQLLRLAVQLDSFNQSVTDAETRAEAAGVDVDQLEELRTNASELAGPEVAEIAQGLAGIDSPGHADEERPGGPDEADDSPPEDDPKGETEDT